MHGVVAHRNKIKNHLPYPISAVARPNAFQVNAKPAALYEQVN